MGIEPTPSAWKAEVLPLNYTRIPFCRTRAPNFIAMERRIWWWGKDSNLRRLSRQIYSLIPLTAWVPHREGAILHEATQQVNLIDSDDALHEST